MKEATMSADWRTVQLFLTDTGVAEVEVDSNNPAMVRCNCKGVSVANRCAHTKHVKKIMDDNDGNYTISVPDSIDEEEAFVAMADSAAFRAFVIKYGKVEVI